MFDKSTGTRSTDRLRTIRPTNQPVYLPTNWLTTSDQRNDGRTDGPTDRTSYRPTIRTTDHPTNQPRLRYCIGSFVSERDRYNLPL